jgi:saccharopine dehydrogenase-like NADP-dependent oxidoreductase
MKKVLILGTGAQGSTVARRLDEEPGVSEIICADYDERSVNSLVKILKKAKGTKIDAARQDEIVKAASGVDIIVNALPLEFGKQVLEAAIEVKANYQDFSAPANIVEEDYDKAWVDGIKIMYEDYGKRFSEIGKTAITGTGSAPGLICVIARRAVRELDSCDTINMLVYEGIEAKRFLPFWWSPITALMDMEGRGYAYENGELIRTTPFSRPVRRKFPELGGLEVELVEHEHDEPVHMGINSEKFFKGAKNIYFKYGGVGADFAKPLYRAGLLSRKEVSVKGQKVIPFEVVLAHLPPAPKSAEEIKEILDEGLVADIGAFVVEVYGKKDGKNVLVDVHLSAPGIVESFESAELTSEMYLTGQAGFIFTKMFVDDKYTQKGLISSDMLTDEQVDYYLSCAEKLDITYHMKVKVED